MRAKSENPEENLVERIPHDPGLAEMGQCVCKRCMLEAGGELLLDLWRHHDLALMEDWDEGHNQCRWQCQPPVRYTLSTEPFKTLESSRYSSKIDHADDCIWNLVKQWAEVMP